MSKVRCSSIKGLNVPASGPEINLNRFSHGQPLDMGGCNITTGTLTINNVRITTCNSTTLNATNVICTGGDVDLGNGDQLIMPNGNSAGRAGGGSPSSRRDRRRSSCSSTASFGSVRWRRQR